MRRLDNYILREISGPLGIGLLVYTFILLMQFLFQSAEMIIRRGLQTSAVAHLLLLYMPSILVLTLPMALLFGILVAVGRLSGESELTAMRACGISLTRLYRPVLMLSLLLAIINGSLTLYLLPRANAAFTRLRMDFLTQTISNQVDPRVFIEDWPPFVLYVFGTSPDTGRWNGVFVAEDAPGRENQVTMARSGSLHLDDTGERLIMELDDAYTHKVDFQHPDRYNLSFSSHTRQLLQDRFTSSQRARVTVSKGVREMTLTELRERARDPSTPDQVRRLSEVEIHKKFAIPVACLVFGLLALPLGITRKRGGKSSGFALSIGVILLYYILLNSGEEAARVGRIAPWMAMWFPNLLLSVLGMLLLLRRNRERGLGMGQALLSLGAAPFRWLGSLLFNGGAPSPERSDRARPTGAPRIVIRLPRLRMRFPNLMDRYVIRRFSWVFMLVMASAMILYIVADLTQNADSLLQGNAGLGVVLSYYKYLSLQIFFDIAPVIVLMTTLVTFSLLSRSNEVTAAKSLGTSLYRLALPALVAALVVVMASSALEMWVLPASNRRVSELRDEIRGQKTPRTYRRADRQWLFGQGRYIYNYQYFDAEKSELTHLQVFEFSPDYQLIRRIYTPRARYTSSGWVFMRGWTRTFRGNSVVDYQRFRRPIRVDYPETPSYFLSEIKPPEQMSYLELSRYVRELRLSGQPVPELQVALQRKLSFPVISLVMALVALPFAFRLGRRGALYGVGVAVVMGMVFYAVFAFFTTLGEAGALPPIVAAWSPNLLFALLSGYLFLGVRT